MEGVILQDGRTEEHSRVDVREEAEGSRQKAGRCRGDAGSSSFSPGLLIEQRNSRRLAELRLETESRCSTGL